MMNESTVPFRAAVSSADFAIQQLIRERIRHPHGIHSPIPESEIEQGIPLRFEAMVRRYPDRIAVKYNGRATTYTELNAHANRIAHALLNHLGPGAEPVVLLAVKDAPVLAAMLGVLKAGKFYIVLDPDSPPQHARAVLANTQTRLLMHDEENRAFAEQLVEGHIASMPIADAARVGIEDERNPAIPISPDAYAYITYTSGTTGAPKGVIEMHRNVLRFVQVHSNTQRFCPQDGFSVLPTLAFNGTANSVYNALLNGGAIFPFPLQKAGFPALVEWLQREEITILTIPANRLHDIEPFLPAPRCFPHVRLVFCGSDRVFPPAIAAFRRIFQPPCIQRVSYGSSEVKTFSGYFYAHDLPEVGKSIPLGYPFGPHIELRIVDDGGRMLPPNQPGQIVARSRYMSPGYWRQPEVTAERFADDPEDVTKRLFFTGDHGYMDEGGCFYFLGRRDFQVKVDGHRIELVGIENEIAALPGVRQVAVVRHEIAPGNARLVAYYEVDSLPGPTISELRRALAAKLPAYMVPALYVRLEQMPRTRMGKIDRAALPPPGDEDMRAAALDVPYVAPRTQLERELAELWSQIIGIEGVGIHDPFLELGGSSLQALRIAARVAETYAIALTPEQLLAVATVAEMAALIVRQIAGTLPTQTVSRLLSESELPPPAA